ncbi:hypothetical protein [Streptomyces sp. NPDC059247]|uniref:hypothetical protein n=1 Tax=Streptomyces sp. NPDC059247 TaxID=3346790 RepID=UPI00369C5097
MQLDNIQGECQDAKGTWPVTFSLETSEATAAYSPARAATETYVNGTRNAVSNSRPVNFAFASSAAFTAAGEPSAARQPTSLTWTTKSQRTISETVQPGEVSWVEVQEHRATGSGAFTIVDESGNKLVITGTFDSTHSDGRHRVMQRTAPMTEAEMKRAAEARG